VNWSAPASGITIVKRSTIWYDLLILPDTRFLRRDVHSCIPVITLVDDSRTEGSPTLNHAGQRVVQANAKCGVVGNGEVRGGGKQWALTMTTHCQEKLNGRQDGMRTVEMGFIESSPYAEKFV